MYPTARRNAGWLGPPFLVFAMLLAGIPAGATRSVYGEETNRTPDAVTDASSESNDPSDSGAAANSDVAAGHSYHGEAFNEGPRQAAELMDGMAPIRFATSAQTDEAQRFIEQGVAQLHGFWYLESERSFRQAAKLEPDLAIAYWGMAMANVNNDDRARGFITEAMERRDGHATRRERLYIEALDRLLEQDEAKPDETKPDEAEDGAEKDDSNDESEKERRQETERKRIERYLADLEGILHEFPDDIEAKALLAVQLWMAERDGVKMPSRYAVSALLDDVFDVRPMHPAHHYKIHLWDRQRPENALESAAKCGPALPGVAHMWHMPGHIYSRLHRYNDAAWQQEASARIDHRHMIDARLMPDEIHNFAHNNEWLTRNLIHVGRVDDALVQARNLVSMPMHPRYNSFGKRGSFQYGHQRLLQVLTTYGLWERLLEEAKGASLAKTGDDELDDERAAWIAVATWMTGDREQGRQLLREMRRQHASDEEEESKKENDRRKKLIARVRAAAAAVRQDPEAVNRNAKTAKLDRSLHARWLARAGDIDGGLELAREAVKRGPGEVPPLAVLVDLLWRAEKRDQAESRFGKLRRLAVHADLETPLLARIRPIADAFGAGDEWRESAEPASDLGERPPLDSLGPFRWDGYAAPNWVASDAAGTKVSGDRFAGQPRVMIFYLGFGCLHCVEQLHAFTPVAERFREAGIELLAVSTESVSELRTGTENFDREISIPLFADPSHEVFKSFRCWDDFEDQPLHGTFLIDAEGRVRWQDISYEPFEDAEFLLRESKRLLESTGQAR